MKQPIEAQPRQGGCLCGAVRYAVDGPLSGIIVCHCKDCQRASGSTAAYNVRVATRDLTITKGACDHYTVTAESGQELTRMFCARCGSQLFSQRAQLPDVLSIKAGTLDDPGGLALARHIWTARAMPWDTIDAELPCHEGEFDGLRQPKTDV